MKWVSLVHINDVFSRRRRRRRRRRLRSRRIK
jgi:hypothetical protein